MGYFIGIHGYYEGDQASADDLEVPQRPSSNYTWSDGWIAVPPPPLTLAETDVWMSRVTEDTVAALLSAGVVVKTDYAPIVIERINYRRSLRNQPPL